VIRIVRNLKKGVRFMSASERVKLRIPSMDEYRAQPPRVALPEVAKKVARVIDLSAIVGSPPKRGSAHFDKERYFDERKRALTDHDRVPKREDVQSSQPYAFYRPDPRPYHAGAAAASEPQKRHLPPPPQVELNKKPRGDVVEHKRQVHASRDHFLPTQNRPNMPWMDWIAQGIKTVEGRVCRKTVSEMRVGDKLTMGNQSQYIICEVISVRRYRGFREMLEKEGVKNLVPHAKTIDDAIRAYERLPGAQDVHRLGTIAIGVRPITQVTRR
jgi:ASC-1-like (ASCH) protein